MRKGMEAAIWRNLLVSALTGVLALFQKVKMALNATTMNIGNQMTAALQQNLTSLYLLKDNRENWIWAKPLRSISWPKWIKNSPRAWKLNKITGLIYELSSINSSHQKVKALWRRSKLQQSTSWKKKSQAPNKPISSMKYPKAHKKMDAVLNRIQQKKKTVKNSKTTD